MKYIFPRQFRLHNVFTSATDKRQTVQRFKDYTMREDEIAQSAGRGVDGELKETTRIPKRLRGKAVDLVQKLQDRNKRCPYVELLRYYCPSTVREARSCSLNTLADADIVVPWTMETRSPSLSVRLNIKQRPQAVRVRAFGNAANCSWTVVFQQRA